MLEEIWSLAKAGLFVFLCRRWHLDQKGNLDLRKAPALIFSCKHGKFSRVLFCYLVAKKSKIADENNTTQV